MISYFKYFLNLNNDCSLGNKLFLIGIFFLPSALPIGGLFLLLALIISAYKNHKEFLKDKWNYPIILSLGIILISTIKITSFDYPIELIDYKKTYIWINLFNWLPSLVCFWAFQFYLETKIQRLNFCKSLLLGTLPILYSCISQFIFKTYGPLYTMSGLIVWFQRPIEAGGAVTGLFNNPNYLASWLSTILPFSLLLLKISKNKFERVSFTLISLTIIPFIILTNSRNGLICLITTLLLYYGFKKVSLFFFGGFFLTLITNFLIKYIYPSLSIYQWLENRNLLNKIFKINFDYDSSPRVVIFKSSLSFIKDKPLLGWGASTFPHLHSETLSKVDAQHTHNIFLELAHNFGIPLSIIIFSSILFLLIKLFKSVKNSQSEYSFKILEKSWLIATFLILVIHTSDITYYDGKINILICTLLAGARTIINSNQTSTKKYLSNE